MPPRYAVLLLSSLCLFAGCASHAPRPQAHAQSRGGGAREQVIATERAFARSMADRDFKAFVESRQMIEAQPSGVITE